MKRIILPLLALAITATLMGPAQAAPAEIFGINVGHLIGTGFAVLAFLVIVSGSIAGWRGEPRQRKRSLRLRPTRHQSV